MNKFEKVSFDQYAKSIAGSLELYAEYEDDTQYNKIIIPKRATKGSAGYDFFAPHDFMLAPGASIKISTGIRVQLDDDKFLALYPRSGLGFKFRVQLDNTVGIIDSDYYNSDNEGHIMAKITNDSRDGKTVCIKQGEAFMQGVITQFFKTADDDCDGIRNGGFGSTSVHE